MGSNAEYAMGQLMAKNDEANARIAELTAEVARYRDALNDIQARVASGYFVDANHLGEIARNALVDIPNQAHADYPECSGDSNSCPENEGYGCCIARNALKDGV